MVQALDKFSKEQNKKMVLSGSSFAMFCANKSKEDYAKYLAGEKEDFSDDKLRDMRILNLLARLRFNLDELGTYLYKDLIVEVYEKIKDVSNRKDMDKCRALMSDLSDAYSSIYHYVARECNEIGVKSFHLYIQKAIEKIDEEKVDLELALKVYGQNPEEQNYGAEAFRLAAYAAEKYAYNYQKPKVKKLSNFPDNVCLKEDL